MNEKIKSDDATTELNEPFLKTREEFKQYIVDNKYVIVKLSATWCNPCKILKNHFNEFFKEALSYNPDIKYLDVDIDKSNDISSHLRVRSIPLCLSFINGEMQYSTNSSKREDAKYFFEQTLNKITSVKNASEYMTDI